MKTKTQIETKVEVGYVHAVNKNVACVRVKSSDKRPEVNHTLLLLDCSGSMSGYIEDVSNDSQKYVAELGKNDYVSVIVFSGHGDSKLVAFPTQCNESGRKSVIAAIKRDVQIMGTTVFSEPLALTLETAKKFLKKVIDDNFSNHNVNAVLFTDGCAVPEKWSKVDEEGRAFDVARKLCEFGAVVSVVGYGVYYDDKFISGLMEISGNTGVYRHISEIEDFGPAIQAVRDAFVRTVPNSFNFTFIPDEGKAGNVFKTTPEVAWVGMDGQAKTNGCYDNEITFFVELSKECSSLKVVGSFNSESIMLNLPVEKLSTKTMDDYVRLKAIHAYLKGDRKGSAELFQKLDVMSANRAMSSYTDREQRETSDAFRQFFRNKKFIGAGLKPEGPNHCVLNVMRTLLEDPGNVVYLAKGAYKRSGELARDPRIIESPHGRSLQAVGYVSNKTRFNFSLRCLKDIKVLPENGRGKPVDMKMYNTYNVILDGNLHTPELEAVLTEPSFKALKDAGVIADKEKYSSSKAFTINLRGIKMISSSWANPSTLGLVQLLKEEAELEEEQTALNARRKATKSGLVEEDSDIYHPKAEKVEGVPVEVYFAKCVEIRLMKYKAKTYNYSSMTFKQADERVKEVRQRLVVVRYLIRSITFAMEAVGSSVINWGGDKTTKKGRDEKLEQTATYQGALLKKVSWKEQFVCS